MDKFMDSPWFLRFTALFLAIILFFSVKADEEKLNGKTVGDQVDYIHEIPVEIYYDDENLVVTGVPETVSVKIEGPINIVQTTKLIKDFTLFVDLRTLTMGEHHVQIKSENFSNKLDVRIDPSTIDVLIEEKVTQTFKVEPELNKSLALDGFNVVSMDVSPSTIKITGAKSIIDSISFVKATVSGEQGFNKSFEQQAKIRVLDKDLNKLNVELEQEEVTVKVEVKENSKEVPILLEAVGTADETVVIESLTTETKFIKLFGPNSVLDTIKEFKVNVDVSKIKGSEKVDVEIKKPKGVSSLSTNVIKVDVKATVTVSTDSEEEISKIETEEQVEPTSTVEFDDLSVNVIGLNKQFKSTLIKPINGLLRLSVTAKADVIDSLKKSDFTISVDATSVDEEGEIVLPVLLKGPEDVKWIISDDEITLKVELA